MTLLVALRQYAKPGSPLFSRSLTSRIVCDALTTHHPSIRRHSHPSAPFRIHIEKRTVISRTVRGLSVKSDDASIIDGNEVHTDVDSIADLLRESYSIGETDGVQDTVNSRLVLHVILENNESKSIQDIACHLIDAAIKAATVDNRISKGALSGMMNAILACCCDNRHSDNAIELAYPELAWEILQQMDIKCSNDESSSVSPDLVTLSLVYYSCCVVQQSKHERTAELIDFYSEIQSKVLERAQKLAKKSAGSSRRKALAAERRKNPSQTSDNITADLQSLYGPDIAVLYENENLIILSKPSGMVCYHNRKTSAGKVSTSRKKKSRDKKDGDEPYGTKFLDISLEDALLDMSVPLSTLNPTARGIVHRIDRGTSGCIMLAKNDETHLKLISLFFLRRVQKKYLALVPARSFSGELDLAMDGTIDSIVDRRPALSKYNIVGRYNDPSQSQEASEPAAMLLEVQTLTGRKHQVRVHCAEGLNRPIFLDPLYSDHNKSKPSTSRDRQSKQKVRAKPGEDKSMPPAIREAACSKEQFFLHASSISIPDIGLDDVHAPLPKLWKDVLMQWEELK
jgi:23S rRNA-/tRNA-specific pseudouridylate synthase